MEEKRYFDSESLKRDLREEVIADIRDDLDGATRQLLRDVKREQEAQAERVRRTEGFYTIFLALVCIINIFLVGRLLAQQNKIKDFEAQVAHMEADIDKITLRVENLKSVSTSKPNPTPTPTTVPKSSNSGVSVEQNDDSTTGRNEKLYAEMTKYPLPTLPPSDN